MKNIEIEEDLYQYIASQTQFIGESATSILRRLLGNEKLGNESSANEQVEQNNIKGAINQMINSTENSVEIEQVLENTSSTDTKDSTIVGDMADANESVFNYLNKEELGMQRGAVGRFLLILGALYRVHSNSFSVVSDIRGRDRLYFSSNLNELTESGSSTKPFQIPESPYWVVTNSNTTRKKMILTKVAVALGYSENEAEDIRELL